MDAVLADVAQHEPGEATGVWALHEMHMPPGVCAEVDSVVIAVSGEEERVRVGAGGKLVPLLACDLARLAANT